MDYIRNAMFIIFMAHALQVTSGARILGVFPHVTKSHFVMAEQLMKGLASKGHEVVVLSHFPQKEKIPNYTDISLVGSMPGFYRFWYDIPSEAIVKKYFGESIPPLHELVRNTSLILANRHFTINQPIPNVPAVIEVGGIHVPIPKKLPQDLDKFMNESEHGVIVFSLGSTVKASTFSEQKRDAFIEAFRELPQRVLWKWEGDALPGQPKNIKIIKWMPQGDVLAHHNVKVFITHGGLMGTMEAVYAGVPMVVIPLFGDQFLNAKSYEEEGVGVQLDYHTITKESVLNAITTVLNDQKYAERAKDTSQAFKDRPMSPLETAIFWTEYVLRHRGAPFLRTAGADLPWYQYVLLDVVSALILIGYLSPCDHVLQYKVCNFSIFRNVFLNLKK
ncbi:hypothetical protein L9F63_008361, partial [Diploptera punctata]